MTLSLKMLQKEELSEQYLSQYQPDDAQKQQISEATRQAAHWLSQEPATLTDDQKETILGWLQADPPLLDVHMHVTTHSLYGTMNLLHAACLCNHAWALAPLVRAGADTEARTLLSGNFSPFSAFGLTALGDSNIIDQWVSSGLPLYQHINYLQWQSIMKTDSGLDIVQQWLDRYAADPSHLPDHEAVEPLLRTVVTQEPANRSLEQLVFDHNGIKRVIQQAIAQNPDAVIAARPMMFAAMQNNTPIIEKLLSLGVSANARCLNVYPLMKAAEHLSLEAYQMLRDAGADVYEPERAKEQDGSVKPTNVIRSMLVALVSQSDSTELDVAAYATKDGHPQAQQKFRYILRDALENGCEINERFALDSSIAPTAVNAEIYGSALHRLLRPAAPAIARLLIEEGYVINALSSEKESPKHMAMRSNERSFARLCETYEREYTKLWQRFSEGRKNPFVNAKPFKSKYLSDHPLALLHAFHAIGKLEEAMQPQYWHGNERMRAAAMDALYPCEKQRIGLEPTAAMMKVNPTITAKNWCERVSAEPLQQPVASR